MLHFQSSALCLRIADYSGWLVAGSRVLAGQTDKKGCASPSKGDSLPIRANTNTRMQVFSACWGTKGGAKCA